MTLSIECPERYNEAFEHARKIGLEDQLKKKLEYLSTYAEHGDRGRTRCRLVHDFAPYSFGFVMEYRGPDGTYKPESNGGLIFHPPADPSGMREMSINIGNEPGWQVHT